MIEKLQDFPDNVAAYACHGHLTKADYAEVIPHIQDKLARHKKLRAYTELAPDFAGGPPRYPCPAVAGQHPAQSGAGGARTTF
ncbi:hypothetical protein BN1232_06028 [Mycobacterium lentiflavum]|uniref:Uncharacterized protein n=1 Tax=Mycobacterium lentiflavum TaxID=141349 RepID=A0A0E3WE84_MYCLN|nr:STAS/SEC14 domain-containing protein [Mycobacterium lentiflavum]CQD24056.1 hypothetical protein BN1232_06028 [Mycobacterium lentiflavum]